MAAACPALPVAPTQRSMPAGTLKRIHVHQQIIRANVKNGENKPAVTVQWRGKSYKARDVKVLGPSVVKQRMDTPLSCGARIWIETTALVELL